MYIEADPCCKLKCEYNVVTQNYIKQISINVELLVYLCPSFGGSSL